MAERYVGAGVQRVDGLDKVSGAARYIDDLEFGPALTYAALVESPHAHARILGMDASAAERSPGVLRVVTGRDLPHKYGLYMKDRYIFPTDRVRFAGEQVAAVVARDPRAAVRAARLVKVEYEPLPSVLSAEQALEGKVLLHPDLGEYPHVPWFFPKAGTNVAHWRKTRKGDVERGFASADLVLEDTYRVPRYAHCAIEHHGAVGLCDHAGRLTVWAASQSPFAQRHCFAEALAPLGISHRDVRVVAPCVGGGFGGKAGVTMEVFAAAIATLVRGSPVKVLWSRAQEFYNTYQRQALTARIKLGLKRDGTITALEHEMHWDAGAYVEYGANIVNAAGLSATGPYRIPNVKIDSVCLYTNLPPSGAYRGFGYSEFHFGLESHLTRAAHRLGMDPVELRRRNAIREGDPLPYGAPMNPSGLHQCIEAVAEAIRWGAREEPRREGTAVGKGFAAFWKAPAMPPNASSGAFLKFNEDGSVNVLVSGMELGQGFMTVMAQIAAEVLSVPPSKVRVEAPDTDRNPYEWQTVASHVTWSCGNAVHKAALDAREQILELVARAHDRPKRTLYLEDERVKCTEDPSFALPLREFVVSGIMAPDGTYLGGPVAGRGMFMPEFSSALSDPETSQGGHPNVHYTVGAAGLVLEVDRETGRMRVLKAVEAIDVGRAINPDLVRGQIVGGVVQGLATVLYEDMRFDERGRLLNPSFTDYKLPTSLDIPDSVVPIIVEVAQPDGPFGARGVGEHPMIPVAPLVANALEDAVGIRLTAMPITQERVAMALREREAGG